MISGKGRGDQSDCGPINAQKNIDIYTHTHNLLTPGGKAERATILISTYTHTI